MNRFLTTASAIALIAASPALAGDPSAMTDYRGGPAVSAPNGKIAVYGGSDDDDGLVYGSAAYSMPLGHSFGLQVDGLVGHSGNIDETVLQGAAHLFWRDPGKGLLGLYGSALNADSAEMYRIGGEGHLYLNRITLEGLAGWDEASSDDGVFLSGTVSYYMNDNTRLFGGARHSDWRDGTIQGVGTVGFVGLEHQTRWGDDRRAYSIFGEARFGEDDHTAAWGGIRIYFGQNKSLMRRHREDDPGTQTPDLEEIVVQAPVVTPPPPPQPPPD